MGDLISREAAIAEIKRIYCTACNSYNGVRCRACNFDDAMSVIDDAPTVDAVEVVRCKDCIHRGNEHDCPMCWTEWFDDPFDGLDSVLRDNTTDDGFCHKGAKMDKEAEK